MKYYLVTFAISKDSKDEVREIAEDIKEILDDNNIHSHYDIDEESYEEE